MKQGDYIVKVYIAIPFEDYQGHYAQDARVFLSESAAEAYCQEREAEQKAEGEVYLDWEVFEREVE